MQAIKSDSFNTIKEIIRDKAEESEAESEEQALAELAKHPGWEILSGYIDHLISQLDNANKAMVDGSSSFEEIGKNAVVVQLAKDVVRKITQKVNDAQEAIEATRK